MSNPNSLVFRRIQHVSVGRPPKPELRAVARAFYRDTLGLPEIPVPSTLDPELIWFQVGDDELHVFPETGEWREPAGDHLCLQDADEAALRAVRARLDSGGCKIVDTTPITNRPRFFTWDPFGNRIEIAAILGPYD